MSEITPAAPRLLVRGLAQLATPAGNDAPRRGEALGEVEVLQDAYVLCDGASIASMSPGSPERAAHLNGPIPRQKSGRI